MLLRGLAHYVWIFGLVCRVLGVRQHNICAFDSSGFVFVIVLCKNMFINWRQCVLKSLLQWTSALDTPSSSHRGGCAEQAPPRQN